MKRFSSSLSVLFALTGLCLSLVPCRANDASFEGVAGSVRPLRGENRFIRMVSEKVVLTAGKNDFTTQADFVFRNESGRKVSAPMGFPEGNYGDMYDEQSLKKSGFLFFLTFVDGHKVTARRTVLKEKEAASSDFNIYWIKTVKFAPRQTRHVRVLARSPYGGIHVWGTLNCLSYNFTGQNWLGNVARSDLEVRIPLKGEWLAVMTEGDNEKAFDFRLEKRAEMTVLNRSWTNWPADLNLNVGLQRVSPLWLADVSTVKNYYGGKFFRAAKMFRVGTKPKGFEPYDQFVPDGFVRDGVGYISLAHLQLRMEDFLSDVGKDYRQLPMGKVEIESIPANKTYTLYADTIRLIYTLGSRQMRWGSLRESGYVTLPTPPIMLRGDGDSTLYVPLANATQVLRIKAQVDAKTHIMTLSRGDWPEK